jgi:hypothetical protein
MKGRNGANEYPPSIQEKVRAAARDTSKAPVELDDGELRVLGHTKKSAARAIRALCVDCHGGETPQSAKAEIAGCLSVGCAVWPFRFGRSPFTSRKREA